MIFRHGEKMQIDANDWSARIDSAHLFQNALFTIRGTWMIRDEGIDYT
jgi:hypothetical protein